MPRLAHIELVEDEGGVVLVLQQRIDVEQSELFLGVPLLHQPLIQGVQQQADVAQEVGCGDEGDRRHHSPPGVLTGAAALRGSC